MAKLFQIPTIQEIYDFIIYKQPSWPGAFSEWYAEKFWNHYQSSGWRLSSNVLMKDWKAAFCSNWKDLKFDAREKLIECEKAEGGKGVSMQAKVSGIFHKFKHGVGNKQEMASCYKWLRDNGFMKFTRDELNKLVEQAGNDKETGRYLAVGYTFKKWMES